MTNQIRICRDLLLILLNKNLWLTVNLNQGPFSYRACMELLYHGVIWYISNHADPSWSRLLCHPHHILATVLLSTTLSGMYTVCSRTWSFFNPFVDDELSVMTWMNNEFLRSCLVAGDGLCTHELHHELCYKKESLWIQRTFIYRVYFETLTDLCHVYTGKPRSNFEQPYTLYQICYLQFIWI